MMAPRRLASISDDRARPGPMITSTSDNGLPSIRWIGLVRQTIRSYGTCMERRAAYWVRLGVAVTLGAPQLLIGLWAVTAPANWFRNFPGFDPRLVAAEPPYNQHLATDAGAGFVATGVVLLVAAMWGNRASVSTALLVYAVFTVPHVLYHAMNPADALTGFEDLANVLALGSGLILASVFAWGVRPDSGQADASIAVDRSHDLSAASR
jgi:hypothetical protein